MWAFNFQALSSECTAAADDDVSGRTGSNNTLADGGAAVLAFLAAGRGGVDEGRSVEESSRDKFFEASALTSSGIMLDQ